MLCLPAAQRLTEVDTYGLAHGFFMIAPADKYPIGF